MTKWWHIALAVQECYNGGRKFTDRHTNSNDVTETTKWIGPFKTQKAALKAMHKLKRP